MFRAILCSSSGGHIVVYMQHMISSPSYAVVVFVRYITCVPCSLLLPVGMFEDIRKMLCFNLSPAVWVAVYIVCAGIKSQELLSEIKKSMGKREKLTRRYQLSYVGSTIINLNMP
jgi:hypothetical protein